MLEYQKGNLFDHLKDRDIIAHCCNDIGAFGSGFAKELADREPLVRSAFLDWAKGETKIPYQLGEVQLFSILCGRYTPRATLTIANMIGQHGVRSAANPHPIDYDALRKAMKKVIALRQGDITRIVAPKFGSGLAGGDWTVIEAIINDVWKDVPVVIFEL